jgi:two-component system cell cycle sensor histidine kinase/response regulator CckA
MMTKQILIVDDDVLFLKTTKLILEPKYAVTTVNGGQQALDLINQDNISFDLIICDLSMPEINGAQLYLNIIKKGTGLEDRFIFMTTGPYCGYINEFSINKKNPCIQKPFTREDLHSIIETFFNNLDKPNN